jgi:hypothetical protein
MASEKKTDYGKVGEPYRSGTADFGKTRTESKQGAQGTKQGERPVLPKGGTGTE